MKIVILVLTTLGLATHFANADATKTNRKPQSTHPRGGCVNGSIMVDEDGWHLVLNDKYATDIGSPTDIANLKDGDEGLFKYTYTKKGCANDGTDEPCVILKKVDSCKN